MALRNDFLVLVIGCLAMNTSFADSARILKIEPRTMVVQSDERSGDPDDCELEVSEPGRGRMVFSPPSRPKTVTIYEVTYDHGGRTMRDTLSYIPINDIEVDKLGRARRLPYDNRP